MGKSYGGTFPACLLNVMKNLTLTPALVMVVKDTFFSYFFFLKSCLFELGVCESERVHGSVMSHSLRPHGW